MPPRATYRLQFHRRFTLRDARELVSYLADLGVSHVYASPLLKARPGSPHGYDVVDPRCLNPELGTEDDLAALVRALRERGMGLVLDIVPNHMGIGGRDNPWWWDVLTHGPASRFADYFDIDWEAPAHPGKVLVPVLGDDYERVLQQGELRLASEDGAPVLCYYEHRFPVAPGTLPAEAAEASQWERLNTDFRALDALLARQHYRLVHWRRGDAELNYRRFFNITTLAGVRVEDPRVFRDTHARLLEWHRRGWLDGLRIDHPDGLRDPLEYFQRLRAAAPGAWIVVEKVLEPGEALPRHWPVAGTTGYDFLNVLLGVFLAPAGELPLTRFYAEFTGEPTDFAALLREKKRLVLRERLAAEVSRLARLLEELRPADAAACAWTREQLRAAIIEVAACFPVYRSYLRPGAEPVHETDAAYIVQALDEARRERPDLPGDLFEHLRRLLLEPVAPDPPAGRASPADFILRFQQLTGPAMAKGLEDTAGYCFNRFVALNEVGGDPSRFGLSVEAFHRTCAQTLARWPDTMLATSTHDTKRSEDVRARLALLSEMPDAWTAAVRRWSAHNAPHRRGGWPDRNAEYLFYQTLVGAWPLSVARALAYMEKAVREASQHTTWTSPNAAYEAAVKHFITATLADTDFTQDLQAFVAPLIQPGHINSLAQTLLKLTAPGVPDIYQGTELWDLSLVDPDNRRPVDFVLRRRWLAELPHLSVEAIWRRRAEGLPKLWVIRQTLAVRRRHPEWFGAGGAYQPLRVAGRKARHLVAFARAGQVITLAPRLPLGLGGDWAATTVTLPPGDWLNALTGERVVGGIQPVADLLKRFPVALLSREPSAEPAGR